jgi:hypothetical protein
VLEKDTTAMSGALYQKKVVILKVRSDARGLSAPIRSSLKNYHRLLPDSLLLNTAA